MIGALIGAGASLLGGLMGRSSAEKQAKQNIKLQKEFAQTGIQWKVKDAEKAGVHPLYALGAQTHSFSPVSVGDPLPGAIADMGQGIGRAVESGMSNTGRIDRVMQALTVERAELENMKLRSEIALANQAGQAPAPITNGAVLPGQAVTVTPAQEIPGQPGNPSIDYAVNPELTLTRTKTGYSPSPSAQTKQAMEDNMLLEIPWSLRNQVLPAFGNRAHTTPPPNSWLPFGANTWKFDTNTWEWRPWNSHLKSYQPNSNLGGR